MTLSIGNGINKLVGGVESASPYLGNAIILSVILVLVYVFLLIISVVIENSKGLGYTFLVILISSLLAIPAIIFSYEWFKAKAAKKETAVSLSMPSNFFGGRQPGTFDLNLSDDTNKAYNINTSINVNRTSGVTGRLGDVHDIKEWFVSSDTDSIVY